MVVMEFDLYRFLCDINHTYERVEDATPHPEYGAEYRLTGEVGEWLTGHGHSAIFYNNNDRWTYHMIFRDDKLPLLFKLTWL